MKIKYTELVSNGFTLRGFLSTPDNGKFDNIVVMFHGFTGHKNENGFLFKQLTKVLVENNIATLRYDFRGSGDSDGDFSEFTFFTEMEDALEIIKEAYALNNNKKIFVLGFSMGGGVATRVSIPMQDYIEKMVLLAPAGNIDLLMHARFVTHPIDEDGNIDMGGFKMNIEMDRTLQNYDMYKDVETFTKPVLIMQGTHDQAVKPEFSRKYHDLYPNSEYILLEGSEHCFTKVVYREAVRENVVRFLTGK